MQICHKEFIDFSPTYSCYGFSKGDGIDVKIYSIASILKNGNNSHLQDFECMGECK